jgi:hypothetical protein
MGEKRGFVEDSDEGFLSQRLRDDGVIPDQGMRVIAGYVPVYPKTITVKNMLHYRCGGLKSF